MKKTWIGFPQAVHLRPWRRFAIIWTPKEETPSPVCYFDIGSGNGVFWREGGAPVKEDYAEGPRVWGAEGQPLFIYLSIIYVSSCLSIYVSIAYPSSLVNHPFIHHLSVYPCIYHLSIHHLLSICPSIFYLSIIYPSIHPSSIDHLFVHSSICHYLSSIYLSSFMYLSSIQPSVIYLSVHPSSIFYQSSIHPSIHPSSIINLSIHPSFIYLSIYLSSFLQCWGWNPGPQACSWCTSTTILPPWCPLLRFN
jgi:hypothetical protein